MVESALGLDTLYSHHLYFDFLLLRRRIRLRLQIAFKSLNSVTKIALN